MLIAIAFAVCRSLRANMEVFAALITFVGCVSLSDAYARQENATWPLHRLSHSLLSNAPYTYLYPNDYIQEVISLRHNHH